MNRITIWIKLLQIKFGLDDKRKYEGRTYGANGPSWTSAHEAEALRDRLRDLRQRK